MIETQRVVLVPCAPRYATLFNRYVLENRDHLERWEPAREADYYTIAGAEARLADTAAAAARGDCLELLMLDHPGSAVLGVCNFSNIVRGPFQACNLGYALAEHWQGRGVAFEAISAALGHVFGELDLHRVMANYMPANTRSANLLERLGFEREGLAHSYLKIAGRFEDHVLTALINPHHERD